MNKIEQRPKFIECPPGYGILLPQSPDNEYQDFPIYVKDANGDAARTSKNHVLRQTKKGGVHTVTN